MSRPWSLVFLALLLLALLPALVLVAPGAAAFEEEHRPLPASGNGDGSDYPGCEVCAYIPDGPDGEPGGYVCVNADPWYENTYSDCVDGGDDFCDYYTFCVIV